MKSYEEAVHDVHDGVHDVQAWLLQVRKLDELINAAIVDRDRLLEMATKITPDMTGMPHACGVSDKVGNAAVRLAALAERINRLVDQYVDHKEAVEAVLKKLPAKEYAVLHRYYVQYMTYDEIAQDLGYSAVNVWRLKRHGMALLKDVVECNRVPVI